MLGLTGGSSKSSSSSRSYLPEQASWLKSVLGTYGGQVGQGQQSYEGVRVAPLTTQQQGLLGSVGDWSKYLTPTTTSPLYAQTGATLSNLLSGEMGAEPYTQPALDELFQAAYAAPARKTWSEYTKPEIQESFSGPGYWSTARMNAVSKGAQDLADTLTSQRAQLGLQAEQTNKQLQEAAAGRALAAIPLTSEYLTQPQSQALSGIQGTQALYGLASKEQAQNQAQIASDMQRWAESQNITDPEVLSTVLSLLGMNYSSSRGSSSSWNAGIQGGATAA